MVGMVNCRTLAVLLLAASLMPACVGRPSIGGGGMPWLSPTPLANKARPYQPRHAEMVAQSVKAQLGAIEKVTATRTTTTYQVGERAWAKRGEVLFSVKRLTASRRAVGAVALRDFRQPCRQVSEAMKGVAPEKRSETAERRDRSDSLVCRMGFLATMFSKRCQPPETDEPWDPETAPVGAVADDGLGCQEEPFNRVRARRGQSFRLAGMVSDGGIVFYAVKIAAAEGTAYLLVDGDGYLRRARYLGWRGADAPKSAAGGLEIELLRPPVRLESGLPLFQLEYESMAVSGAGGQVHYEVVYNGLSRDTRGTSYHLIYKEFHADNPEEPIHMRDLGYKADQKQIEIVGVNVQVDEVSESRILYTVLGD